MSVYDFVVKANNGEEKSLAAYKGKVLLIVNTATRCGFTPQYKGLEELYRRYKDYGFEIIDVPCNQFMNQAPEDDRGIQNFCSIKYDTTFLRMKKADVNGENELPLYTYLKSQQGFHGFGKGAKALGMSLLLRKRDWHYKENPDIKWNFTKFLVDRQGQVVGRFEPTESMELLESQLLSCLKEAKQEA